MPRKARMEISDERKQQIDTGNVRLLKTQDAAYLLGYSVRTLQHKVRSNRTLKRIARRINPKGEIYFDYEELMSWLRSCSVEDTEIEAELARATQ